MRLTSKQTGAAAFFAATKGSNKDGSLSATIKSSGVEAQIGSQVRAGVCCLVVVRSHSVLWSLGRLGWVCFACSSRGATAHLRPFPAPTLALPLLTRLLPHLQGGVFEAALLLGDTRAAAPVEWRLGEVAVLHVPLDDGSQPQGPKPHPIDVLMAPRPEIVHMHRPADKRTPGVVSLAAAAACLAPLPLLLVLLARVGANVKVGRS